MVVSKPIGAVLLALACGVSPGAMSQSIPRDVRIDNLTGIEGKSFVFDDSVTRHPVVPPNPEKIPVPDGTAGSEPQPDRDARKRKED